MSALYGTLRNNRSERTQRGFSFLSGHIRGWTSGVRVEAIHDENGDQFFIYKTGGSLGHSTDQCIGVIKNGVVELKKRS